MQISCQQGLVKSAGVCVSVMLLDYLSGYFLIFNCRSVAVWRLHGTLLDAERFIGAGF
jgi:hypothetical protein